MSICNLFDTISCLKLLIFHKKTDYKLANNKIIKQANNKTIK